MEKGSNKSFLCWIVVLALLVLGLTSYIVYDKVIVANNQNNDNQKVLSEDEVKLLANDLIDGLNLMTLKKKSINDFNDLNNDIKLEFMMFNFDLDGSSSDLLLSGLKSIFGEKFTIDFKDIYLSSTDLPAYKYNSTTKKYESNLGFGIADYKFVKNEVVDYEEGDGYYYVSFSPVIYIDSEGCEKEAKIYNFSLEEIYTINSDEENVICSASDLNLKDINDNYDKFKNKLDVVKYKFKYENNKLYLVGYEIKN